MMNYRLLRVSSVGLTKELLDCALNYHIANTNNMLTLYSPDLSQCTKYISVVAGSYTAYVWVNSEHVHNISVGRDSRSRVKTGRNPQLVVTSSTGNVIDFTIEEWIEPFYDQNVFYIDTLETQIMSNYDFHSNDVKIRDIENIFATVFDPQDMIITRHYNKFSVKFVKGYHHALMASRLFETVVISDRDGIERTIKFNIKRRLKIEKQCCKVRRHSTVQSYSPLTGV